MSLDAANQAFARLVECDVAVAKALGISEVARIAKMETRSRDYLLKTWRVQAALAVSAATAASEKGKKAEAVADAVDAVMGKWSKGVLPTYNGNVAKVYELARIAGHKKASGESSGSLQYDGPLPVAKARGSRDAATTTSAGVSLDLEDRGAIEVLQRQNVFWIGNHYEANVSPAIREATAETLGAGTSRRAAGIAIRERIERELGDFRMPSGWRGTAAEYFDGLAANTMTVARASGQLRSLDDLGVEKYVIVNPLDERTCAVCGHLEGKIFNVSSGRDQLAREAAARTPEDIKRLHPWLSAAQVLALSPRAGAAGGARESGRLASAGFSMPPFHFKCRCTIDIES